MLPVKGLAPKNPPPLFRFPWGAVEYVAASDLRGQFFEIFVQRHYAFAAKVAEHLAGTGREGAKVRKRLLTVEDAAKIIISAGMINPETQARLRNLADKPNGGLKT